MRKLVIPLIFLFFFAGCEAIGEIVGDLWYSPLQKHIKHIDPDAVYHNGYFFVVWGDGDIFGRKISPEGQFLTDVFKITEDETLQVSPRIAPFSSRFIVVWVDHRTPHGWLYYQIIPSIGVPQPRPGHKLEDAVGTYSIDVAFSDHLLAVFSVERERYNSYAYITTYDTSMSFQFSVSPGWDTWSKSSIAFVDGYLGALSGSQLFIYDYSGSMVNHISLPEGERRYLSSGDGVWALVYTRFINNQPGNDIVSLLTFVNTEGIVDPPGEVAFRTSPGGTPWTVAVGYDSLYLCAWVAGDGIYATRVTTEGEILDTEPIYIAQGSYIERLRVIGGPVFLVLWDDDESVYGRLIDKSGDFVSSILKISP